MVEKCKSNTLLVIVYQSIINSRIHCSPYCYDVEAPYSFIRTSSFVFCNF